MEPIRPIQPAGNGNVGPADAAKGEGHSGRRVVVVACGGGVHLQVEVGAGAPRPSAVSAEMVFGNLWAGDVQSLDLNLCIIASAGWGPWGPA